MVAINKLLYARGRTADFSANRNTKIELIFKNRKCCPETILNFTVVFNISVNIPKNGIGTNFEAKYLFFNLIYN
jgi:hypothetical protein